MFRYKECKMSREEKSEMCLFITFNSRHHGMTSIERYIGHSTVQFIRNVAYA